VRELVGPTLTRLGREARSGDGDRERDLRGALIEAAGVTGADPDVRAFAREVVASVDHAGSGTEPPDPSILAGSIAVVADSGGADDYDEFRHRFLSARTPQQELRYLYALAAFDDDELIDRLTGATLSDEIRSQNAPYLLGRAMGNREHGVSVWAFVRDRWDDINERFPSNSIVRMLGGIRALDRPGVADDVFSFFEEHEVPQGDKQLAQHLERLEVNVALRARATEALTHHLTR
jgi:puromycin-sensitive aminopeptidase